MNFPENMLRILGVVLFFGGRLGSGGAEACAASAREAMPAVAQSLQDFAPDASAMPALRADVVEVRGVWREDGGRVAWRTEAAWGTAGYHVYRIDPDSGGESRLNECLVPASFYRSEAAYEVPDSAACEGDAGTYRLEEVELSGVVFDLGVHSVVFAAAPPLSAPVAVLPPAAAGSLAPLDASSPFTTSSVLRVSLKKEGIYGVGLASIAAGMGLAFEEVQALAEAGMLGFRAQGRPVPVLYDENRERLLFHAVPTECWYTRDAAYLITAGEGLAMPRRQPGATNGETVFPAQIRFEEDRLPLDGAIQKPEDFYYWNYIVATANPASNQVDFAINLDGYEGGALTLRVDLQGWSQILWLNPDHHAEFKLNGTAVGDLAFDNQNVATAELAIPAGIAANGTNTLTVRGALPPGYSHSYFVLDGIAAEYDRTLVPGGETTHVRAGEALAVSAQAFEDPLVLALDGDGWYSEWIADTNGLLPDKAWAVAVSNERFAVIEAAAVPMLEPEPVADHAWFMAATNRIDYVVIAPRALAAEAQALADYRASQGWRTGLAVYEDVCDLLYDGLRTPEAIPELTSYAWAYWAEPPKMAVLAGNGHYDFLEAMSNEVNHLPPLLVQTTDGLFASDERFGDGGGDELPETAIGRLPARTAEELAAMIAKIEAYEADFGAGWQNELAFAADRADAAAGDFPASNMRLANLVAAPYQVSARFDLDTTPIAPARALLLGRFNAGAGFIHYTGHGTSVKWSSLGLLTAADVNALTNERKPVVVSLCCLAGRYEAPGTDSLAERLMQRAAGGGVAVWASSGMARNAPAADLAEAFYADVLQGGSGTLGLSILLARHAVPEDMFNRDTLTTYNLLGDPALRIAGNPGGQPRAPEFAAAEPQSATCRVAMAFAVAATGIPPPVVELQSATAAAGSYAFSAETGQLDYTPPVGDIGAQTFVFRAFNGAGAATQTVVVTVAPGPPHVVFSRAAVNVREAGEGRFYVRLECAPTAAVVAVASRVAGDGNLTVQSGGTQTFTPANWDAWRLVTLAAAEDANETDETATFQVAATGASNRFLEATALDDDFGENLALASRGATISGQGSCLTALAIDGMHAVPGNYAYTIWTNVPPGTMTLDLNPGATVSRVRILNFDWSYRVHRYLIESSPDGTNWTVLADASAEARHGWDDWPVADAAIRYLRFTGLSNSANRAVCIPEWEVYGAAKSNQTINFPDPGTQERTNAVVLSASATSGLPVGFAVTEGPAVLAGATLTFTGTGRVGVAASQPGDENWNPAPDVIRTFQVVLPKSTVMLSTRNVHAREAGEGRLFIRLAQAPEGALSVATTRIGGDTNIVVAAGASLAFNAANWQTWRAVTLVAGEDENAIDETATLRISAPGVAEQYLEATALDDDLGENLALASGGATISGQGSCLTALAIDGVHAVAGNYAYTIWTNSPPGSMTLDLKAGATVSRVRLLNLDWSYRVSCYMIESSPDGTNWTLLADASAEARHGWDDWPVADEAIRYLRFTGLSNSANRAVCVAEWEVLGTRPPLLLGEAGTPDPAPETTAADALDAVPATVATSDDGPDHTNGWAAVDGDANTAWIGSASGGGAWYIAVGYDAARFMTNVRIDLAAGSQTNLFVLHSLDGRDWRDWPANAGTEGVETGFLWLLFPGDENADTVPQVIEIRPQP